MPPTRPNAFKRARHGGGTCLALLGLLCASCSNREDLLLQPGTKAILISTTKNNGSFEDWSRASKRPEGDKNELLLVTPGRDLRIPGWTARSDRRCGFRKGNSSTHLQSRFFGDWHVEGHLVSNAYAASSGISEGTIASVSFDVVTSYTNKQLKEMRKRKWGKKHMLEVIPYLVFDGTDTLPKKDQGVFVHVGRVYIPRDHTSGEPIPIRDLRHTLTAVEAAAADKHGIRLFFQCRKNETRFYEIDRVELTLEKPETAAR